MMKMKRDGLCNKRIIINERIYHPPLVSYGRQKRHRAGIEHGTNAIQKHGTTGTCMYFKLGVAGFIDIFITTILYIRDQCVSNTIVVVLIFLGIEPLQRKKMYAGSLGRSAANTTGNQINSSPFFLPIFFRCF